jgi:hypothetical protein
MENHGSVIIKKFFEIYKNVQENGNNSQNMTEPIAIVDFLNLARNAISNRPDARFQTIDEFIVAISELAKQIKEMASFDRIYLVTKSFKFDNLITYKDVIRIILWSFCKTLPEWIDRVCLVLVNGINVNDKEADDRTLFILYDEFTKTIDRRVVILSNDNFGNLKKHFLRKVILNFFWVKRLDETWQTSEIIVRFKGSFQQNTFPEKNNYNIMHLFSNKTDIVTVQ